MNEFHVGDKVRVKRLAAIGEITHISDRLKKWPYLVRVPGFGERSYSADEFELLPAGTVMTLPPAGAPITAVLGQSGAYICGHCWRIIDASQPTCAKCGATWRLDAIKP